MKASPRRLGPATLAIHSQQHQDPLGSPHVPLYDTTTFRFPSTADLLEVTEGRRRGPFYTRYGLNPTIQALEDTLAALESAEAALAFASGMAAISSTLLAHGRAGVACAADIYGGTQALVMGQLPMLGIPTQLLPNMEAATVEAALRSGARVLLIESPTNPTLQVLDIARLAEQAHEHDALLVVDNTFASPINQQPLNLGADLVVHSATKYLGGHSDLTAGSVMGAAHLLEPIGSWRQGLGSVLAPATAALLSRSLRTLPLRIARHNDNALALAEALQHHPAIRRVLYPGLPSHPQHELARQQMQGFGGMLGLEIRGDRQTATAVADRLELFALAPSLGGAESLVTQPCTTSHANLSANERRERGISDSLLRLSVGLEDSADLLHDLEQALDGLQGNGQQGIDA